MKRQSVLIENDGDVDCGCVIKIKASGGTVMNPKVYNVNTGDFIGFEDLTLEDGDTLIITTEVREENAIRHIVSENKDVSVVGKILTGSKFIQIEKGSSYYAYEVEEQSKNNVEVSIEFVQKYFNIGGNVRMIEILDKRLKKVDILRKYTFAQYSMKFRDIGTFTIDAVITEENLFLLNEEEEYSILFDGNIFGKSIENYKRK